MPQTGDFRIGNWLLVDNTSELPYEAGTLYNPETGEVIEKPSYEVVKTLSENPQASTSEEINTIINKPKPLTDTQKIETLIGNLETRIGKQIGTEQKGYSDLLTELKDAISASGVEQQEYLKDIFGDYQTQQKDLATQLASERAGLISKLGTQGEKLISDIGTQRQQRMASLADLLAKQREQAFAENAPDILEQLSGRNLLRSSATGEALAKEKGRLQQLSESQLQSQALQDLEYEQNLKTNLNNALMNLQSGGLGTSESLGTTGLQNLLSFGQLGYGQKSATNQALINALQNIGGQKLQSQTDLGRLGLQTTTGLETAGLERQFSVEDQARADALARELGKMQGEATKTAGEQSMLGNIVGTGLGVGASLLLSDKKAKKDIKKIGELADLPIYKFKYKGDDKERTGFIAQDVEEEYPDAVMENKGSGMKYIDLKALKSHLNEVVYG